MTDFGISSLPKHLLPKKITFPDESYIRTTEANGLYDSLTDEFYPDLDAALRARLSLSSPTKKTTLEIAFPSLKKD